MKLFLIILEQELKKHEQKLYECALAVEQDSKANREMQDWDITVNDGLEQ